MSFFDDGLTERPAGDAAAALRISPDFRAPVAAVFLLLHIGGLFALDLLDRLQPPESAGAAVEIPVEVVSDEPGGAAPEAKQSPDAASAQSQPPQPQPSADAAAQSRPDAAARPQRDLVIERPRESGLPQKDGAHGAQEISREQQDGEQDSKPEKPQEQPFGALASLDEVAATPQGPTFLSPQTLFRPRKTQPTKETGNDNYRARVLQKVQDAMIAPERPRPKAIALVSFSVDANGALVAIALARPSGNAALDAEALDMVRRAAPFPPPPANADRTFGAFIEFGG